jgi:hypothetical protein
VNFPSSEGVLSHGVGFEEELLSLLLLLLSLSLSQVATLSDDE